MLRFHAILFVRPPDATAGSPISLGSRQVTPLEVSPQQLNLPLPVSFEQVGERLETLPRMFFEPDGSFVWLGDFWQLDGMLYDRSGRLLYAEVKGQCPAGQFETLLAAFGWPETQIVFQLVIEGVTLDEQAFREFAEGK